MTGLKTRKGAGWISGVRLEPEPAILPHCSDQSIGRSVRRLTQNPRGSRLLREMCQGGVCDSQTHRCIACGTQDGSPCCPPDYAQATARCRDPSLYCEYDPQGFYESGTCRACGRQGRPPCSWGCEPGLGLRNDLCDICGNNSQPPCDDGCHAELELARGLCRQCGSVGQIACDRGCNRGLGLRNGLCAVCGAQGQIPCDSGCDPGTVLINGLCALCGYEGQPRDQPRANELSRRTSCDYRPDAVRRGAGNSCAQRDGERAFPIPIGRARQAVRRPRPSDDPELRGEGRGPLSLLKR